MPASSLCLETRTPNQSMKNMWHFIHCVCAYRGTGGLAHTKLTRGHFHPLYARYGHLNSSEMYYSYSHYGHRAIRCESTSSCLAAELARHKQLKLHTRNYYLEIDAHKQIVMRRAKINTIHRPFIHSNDLLIYAHSDLTKLNWERIRPNGHRGTM